MIAFVVFAIAVGLLNIVIGGVLWFRSGSIVEAAPNLWMGYCTVGFSTLPLLMR